MTNAIFSKEYYTSNFLFRKDCKIENKPDGSSVIHFDASSDFWKYRSTHAVINADGTIATIPFSFFDDLLRYFRIDQDPHLIAVHRKLKNLETQIQNPLSPELQILQQEIHAQGGQQSLRIKSNLETLNKCFESGNEKGIVAQALLKVVNCFRSIFHLEPLEFYSFTPLNLQLFKENVFLPAMELTPQERMQSRFLCIPQNNSSLPLPAELTLENFQKLEYGLLNNITFELDGKSFTIEYNRERAEFIFSYTSSPERPSVDSYFQRSDNFNFRSPPLNINEKKFDGTADEVYPLQYSIEYSHKSGPWYTFSECFTLKSGSMAMKANREYTVPLSQGNLCLKVFRQLNH